MNKKTIAALAGVSFFWCVQTAAALTTVDNTLYAELLAHYVKDGIVHYQGFKSDEKKLDAYLQVLERVDSSKLSRNEQFAFYVNAYNAWTIKLILDAYPGVKSIKDLGSLFKSPWKKTFVKIDGQVMTLDEIEHGILRPRFRDPRVHVAVNCASKSCPPLMAEPYNGVALEKQLDRGSAAFVNDTTRNFLDGNVLYVSKIFKWFAEDFDNDPLRFFRKYARGDLQKKLQEAGDAIIIRYLDYDWSLNGT